MVTWWAVFSARSSRELAVTGQLDEFTPASICGRGSAEDGRNQLDHTNVIEGGDARCGIVQPDLAACWTRISIKIGNRAPSRRHNVQVGEIPAIVAIDEGSRSTRCAVCPGQHSYHWRRGNGCERTAERWLGFLARRLSVRDLKAGRPEFAAEDRWSPTHQRAAISRHGPSRARTRRWRPR